MVDSQRKHTSQTNTAQARHRQRLTDLASNLHPQRIHARYLPSTAHLSQIYSHKHFLTKDLPSAAHLGQIYKLKTLPRQRITVRSPS